VTAGVARLWLLAALRRPGRGAAAVIALVIMTVATSGATVAAESLERLFVADAEAEWGEVDVEGRPAHNSVFDDMTARFLATRAGQATAGGAPRLVLPVAASMAGSTETGLVLGLGPEERAFSPLRALDGLSSTVRLEAGQVLLNERLAKRVRADVGDAVSFVVEAPRWEEQRSNSSEARIHPARAVRFDAQVVGVVADEGAADLHRAPLVLMSRDALQRQVQLPGKSSVLHLRATGDRELDADELVEEIDHVAARAGVDLETVKVDALDLAHEEGGLFRSILLFLAALVLLAAAGGATAVIASSTQQRSSVLALLRAQGVTAEAARRLVLIESLAYALVAVAVGSLLAVPAGSAVAAVLADHLATLDAARGRERVALDPSIDPVWLGLASTFVFGAAAFSARTAARRVLPPDVDTALRGLPPLRRDRLRLAVPMVAVLVGGFALGVATAGDASGAMLYMGLSALLGAIWLGLRRQRTDSARRRLDRNCALTGLIWAVGGAVALGDMSQGVQAGFSVIMLAGGLTIVCACVLLTENLARAMRGVRLYAPAGPVQAALLTAGARAEAERDRSGVAVATVASAVFGLVALNVLGNISQISVDRQGGGFDVIGTSVAELDTAGLRDDVASRALVSLPSGMLPEADFWVEDDDARKTTVPYPVRAIGASAELASAQGFGLAAAMAEYRDARAALQAVIIDQDKVVLDRRSRPEGAQPGDDVVIDTGAGTRRFTLAAVLDTFLLGAVFLGETPLRDIGVAAGENFVLAATESGTSPQSLSDQLADAGAAFGLRTQTAGEVRADVTNVNRTFTDVFAAVLALSVCVAVVSLAAGVLHTGRKNRTALGVLRASGAGRGHAALALVAEPVLLTALGICVGLAGGVGVLWSLFRTGFSDLPFVVDLPRLSAVVLATLGCVCLASFLAAIPPVRADLDDALHELG
jgi:putative ABC transport system permease protein